MLLLQSAEMRIWGVTNVDRVPEKQGKKGIEYVPGNLIVQYGMKKRKKKK